MKAKYRGPGDAVELDGLSIKKGETVEITGDQARRIREAGGELDEITTTAKAAGKES